MGNRTYDKGGNKVLTRKAAMELIACGDNPADYMQHPNYHVRVAAWKASGSELPYAPSDSILGLFENLCPNIYARCLKQIEQDKASVKENQKAIGEAMNHNEAYQKKGEGEMKEIPTTFVPFPIEQYAERFASTNALAREFLTRLDVCLLLASK